MPEAYDLRKTRLYPRHALQRLGAKAAPQLIEAFKADPLRTQEAIYVLDEIRDPETRELLAGELKHDSAAVRRGVAYALGQHGNPTRRAPLIEPVTSALVEALRDVDPEVRSRAAQALTEASTPAVIAALTERLSFDLEKDVRAAAAQALGGVEAPLPEVVAALNAANGSDLFSVRHAAAESLRKLDVSVPQEPDPVEDLVKTGHASGAAPLQVSSYESIARAPGDAKDVVFLMARSNGNRAQFPANQLLVERMIEALPFDSHFAVILFSTLTEHYPDTGRLTPAEAQSKKGAIEFVRSAFMGGGNCLQMGLPLAFELLNTSTAEKKAVVYVGNGFCTCPGFDLRIYRKESLEIASRLNLGPAAIHTMAGGEHDEAFLRLLAGMNGGTFTRLVAR